MNPLLLAALVFAGGTVAKTSNTLKVTESQDSSSGSATPTTTSSPSDSSASNNQRSVTTSTALSSSSSSDTSPLGLFKINLFSTWDESPYFSLAVRVGGDSGSDGQQLELRVDIVQPEIWVMDSSAFFNCSYLNDWITSVGVIQSTSPPSSAGASITALGSTTTTASVDLNIEYSIPSSDLTASEATATVCAWGGVYTSLPTSSVVSGNLSSLDGQNFTIPYLNTIKASGNFATDNVSIVGPEGDVLVLPDFTFVNVKNSSAFYGALGLAGNPTGTGFLYAMRDAGLIKSPGYSLWFNGSWFNSSSVGQIMPGYVDSAYFKEPLLSFQLLPHHYVTNAAPTDTAYDSWNVTIPTLLLDDLIVENPDTSQTLSLFSAGSTTSGYTVLNSLPVMVDSRASNTYLPLQLIILLAQQVNAYYAEDIGLWLVPCTTLMSSTSTLNFKFNSLTIKILLSQFMTVTYYGDDPLRFANGQEACSLDFRPSDITGYNSLGVTFLSNIFMAVDNEGGNIAVAAYNPSLASSKLLPTTVPEEFFTTFPTGTTTYSEKASNSSNVTISSTIAYIESGSIPFASSVSVTSLQTLSITVSPSSNISSLPAVDVPQRLYGKISGGVVITEVVGGSSTTGNAASSASAAKEHTSTAGAAAQLRGKPNGELAFRLGLIYALVLGILGVVLL